MPLPARLSRTEIASLLSQADNEAASAKAELLHAQPIAEAAGLSIHSSILDPSYQPSSSSDGTTTDPSTLGLDLQQEAALVLSARQSFNPLRNTLRAFPHILSTSGGYSNTDHIIHYRQTPANNNNNNKPHEAGAEGTLDKLSEYKRSLKKRHRQLIIESRGADRWDLPRRIPGGRRRRIKRDVEFPSAPPEPPSSGYVLFVSQMTCKLRNDHPHRPHNQIQAVRKISHMWNKMSDVEQRHYKELGSDATREYQDRLVEYRATGSWTPYTCIDRLSKNKLNKDVVVNPLSGKGGGPWVRIPYEKKNELERELEEYDQVIFPPRPTREMEEEYERKLEESKERRKRRRLEEGRRWD